ncbi:hypothetical protein, partial [Nocardioides sp.]|uniref:hypothetical protein n=1 Tax=Nocardioides sp. TaxID=35761 RepID=UPI002F3F2E8F
ETLMVPVVEVVFFVLLAVACFLWFRRTPTYRLHRHRSGTVLGQSSSYDRAPQLRPELRREGEPPLARRWWFGRRI